MSVTQAAITPESLCCIVQLLLGLPKLSRLLRLALTVAKSPLRIRDKFPMNCITSGVKDGISSTTPRTTSLVHEKHATCMWVLTGSPYPVFLHGLPIVGNVFTCNTQKGHYLHATWSLGFSVEKSVRLLGHSSANKESCLLVA